MKVLVLGYGSMGRRHATLALELGCDVAVYDPAHNSEQLVLELLPYTTYNADLARQQQVVAFSREDDAWAWEPDAVVIATPAYMHSENLHEAAVRLGVPIFIEKPLALSVNDYRGEGACWVAGDAGFTMPHVQVGYNWRFHPIVCGFRQRAVELGPARVASIWVASDMRTWPGKNYADALLECSHELDLALDLFGPVELGSPVTPVKRDIMRDAWRLELHHATGCRTFVTIAGLAARPLRGLRALFGEYEGGYDVPPDDPRSVEALDISYVRELRYFLDVVAGRTPPDYDGSPRPASLQDGLNVLELVDRARALVV